MEVHKKKEKRENVFLQNNLSFFGTYFIFLICFISKKWNFKLKLILGNYILAFDFLSFWKSLFLILVFVIRGRELIKS